MEKPKTHSKLTVYIHGIEQKIGPSYDKYQSAVELCRTIFPALAHATQVVFYAMDLDVSKDYPIEICSQAWPTASRKFVVVDQSSKVVDIRSKNRFIATLKVKTMTGKTVSVYGIITVAGLKERMQQLDGTPVHLQQLISEEKKLADNIDLYYFLNQTMYLKWKGT